LSSSLQEFHDNKTLYIGFGPDPPVMSQINNKLRFVLVIDNHEFLFEFQSWMPAFEWDKLVKTSPHLFFDLFLLNPLLSSETLMSLKRMSIQDASLSGFWKRDECVLSLRFFLLVRFQNMNK